MFDLQRFSTNGTNSNDTLSNTNNYSAVYAYSGNDYIYNDGYRSSIYAGDGDDTIYHYWQDYAYLDGGAGNDSIYNYIGYSLKIDGGAGNDVIRNYSGNYLTISGGTGNDTIYGNNRYSYSVYQYSEGDGNDIIYNYSAFDTISLSGISSYDTLTSGDNFIISVEGSGSITLVGAKYKRINIKDSSNGLYIDNYTKNITVNGEYGNDTIENYAGGVKIYAGNGNDTIYTSTSSSYTINNSYGYVTIDGGAGNDSISSHDPYVSINGGSGNDTIEVGNWSGITIKGGTGNDVIYSSSTLGILYQYANGDGNDTIYGFSSYDTLSISGNYQTLVSGNDLIYSVGSGAVYLKDYSTFGGEYITNSGSHVTLTGSENNDTIENIYSYGGDYVSINAGAGDDSIYNNYGWNLTIDAGAGDDSITDYRGSGNSINGGAGNDLISLSSNRGNTTVRGGTGNDTIYGDSIGSRLYSYNYYGIVYQYSEGDGNDIIYNYKSTDTLDFGNATYSSSISGNDVIFTVGNGKITLVGAKGKVGSLTSGFSDGDDIYYNYSSGIYGYYRNGNYGSKSNTVLNALAGNDTVYNYANNVTINGDDGDDKISNSGLKPVLNGGAGNDSIYNDAHYATINAGTDADTVYNYLGNGSYINLGDGADSFYGYYNDTVTVYGGTGNDTIKGSYWYSKLYGESGDDQISINGGNDNTIDGGEGNDTIYSSYGGSINGGAGADFISIGGSNGTISGGTGNDTIYSGYRYRSGYRYFQYTYGDGSDLIYGYLNGDVFSIAGTSEYTTLKSGSNAIISIIGSGAVTLDGAANKNISVRGGTYRATTNTDDGVYIQNSTSYRTISGSNKNDTIENIYSGGGDYVSINTGAGTDSIYNDYGWNLTIDAGAGADTITSRRGSSNSINGGDGNDIISLSSSRGMSVIKGGKGNDTIYGDNVAHLYQYDSGDGNDVIYGYNSKDSITISGGTGTISSVGNNVIIGVGSGKITLVGAKGKTINVYSENATTSGGGTSTISGGGTSTTSGGGTSTTSGGGTSTTSGGGTSTTSGGGTSTTSGGGTSTTSGGSQQEVIQTFMSVLDTVNSSGISALNQAVSIASGGYFTNINAAVSQMILDCQNSGGGTNFLKNYCGIDLSNTDTGAITGKDAGGSTTKTANSVVPESTSLVNFTGNNFTTNGITIQLANINDWGNVTNLSYSSLTDKQKYIWQGLYTWWLGSSFDLISDSYGNNYGFDSNSSATVNKMYVNFYRENSNTLAYVTHWYSPSNGKASQLSLSINMNYYDSVNTSDPNGSSSVTDFYLDRTLAHELTHAVMAANIDYFAGLPKFISEGMAELTHGVDDERQSEITYLANNPTVLQNALSITSNSYYAYAGGYMFLRYLAKQSAENASSAIGGSSDSNMLGIVSRSNNASSGTVTTQRGLSISGAVLTAQNTFDEDLIDLSTYSSTVTKVNASALSSGVMIIGNSRANSLKGGKGADTISGNTGKDTIYGGNGNDLIFGDAGDDKLYGEAGNDTLYGGYGKNTLTGGDGKDVFVYGGGNDYIADYKPGTDKIQIVEGEITRSSISGSNVILTVSNGAITVKGGKGKNITVIDKDGNETTKVYSNSSAASENAAAMGIAVGTSVITVKSTFSGDKIDLIDYSSTVTKVNASALSSGIEIVGNSKANSLRGGKGADTISGGTGNDTLTGGSGKDIFIYSSGNDVITDYSPGNDKIKISDTSLINVSISGSDAILRTTNGNIKVVNGKGKKLTVIDSGGKETTTTYNSGTTPLGLSIKNSVVTADSTFIDNQINMANYSGTKHVDASAVSKTLTITGTSAANTILGGKGNDLLKGEAGKDTILGGAGNDSILGGDGNDLLKGETGKDTILGGAGNDSILGGDGNDLLKGEAGKDTILGGAGNDLLYGGNDNDLLKGEAGNDTLYGGAGNDTLYGGAGNDVFVYEGGKDVITDYATGDKIKISSGTISKTSYSGKDIVFKIGSGTLTVKNGKGKTISVVNSSGKTTTYKKTTDLFEDNNFIANALDLDSITEQKVNVQNIETQNYNTLAQDKTWITFTDK